MYMFVQNSKKKIAEAILGAIKVSSKRKESIMFCNVEITSAFFHESFCGEGYTTLFLYHNVLTISR